MATSESDSSTRRSGIASHARLLAAAAAMAVCLGAVSGAQAAIIDFKTTLDQAQEVPPSGTPAMANGTLVMDTVANTLSFNIVITVAPASGELFSHIHGFAPPGMNAGILFNLPNGSPKVGVWNFMEAQEANIIAGQTYANIHSNAFGGGEIRGQIIQACGDGVLDVGEQCDDGNQANGDCCDSACKFEPAASDCALSVCDVGDCDGAGTCVTAARTNCKSALKSLLLLKDDGDATKDKLIWKWIKGDLTTVGELGVPTATTAYTLCVYAGTGPAKIAADVAANGTLWTATSTGFKYKDKPGSSDGIQKVILKAGAAGKAKALVKGKGANLPDLPGGTLPVEMGEFPVTAQLVNSDNVCFEGVFPEASVKKNEADQFKAKAQ